MHSSHFAKKTQKADNLINSSLLSIFSQFSGIRSALLVFW